MKNYKKIVFLLAVAIVAVISISQVTKDEPPPSEMNTENETKFHVPEAEKIQFQEIEPLQAESFEIQVLSEMSDVGNTGDLLLTIIGSGFYLTSVSPRVVFNEDFLIKDTEVNEKGTELYVILSQETLENLLSRTDLKEAQVLVGGKEVSNDSGKISISPNDFTEIERSNIVSLKYRNGFFVREK